MRIQGEVTFDWIRRKSRMNLLPLGVLVWGIVWCMAPRSLAQNASSDASSSASAPAIAGSSSETVDEIVRKLVQQNERRAEELKGYTDRREYTVIYHGFPSMKASMTVDARYTAPSDKRFQIISESGSKLLANRVLKKLLESEQEAAKNPGQTALSPANYTFSLLGERDIAGRRCYRMHVEPRKASKFLYRGTVFVDAQDYAVVQIEAEPAQNPSFWIRKTYIHHTYAKTGDFWLPEHNRSESSMRLGGTAVLTIDYGQYVVQGTR